MDTVAAPFQVPEVCPACCSQLEDEGSFLYCRSKSCPAKASGSIRVWVERLGLLHWGDALIAALTGSDDSKVQTVADLYRLSVDDIAACSSGMKMAKKCHDVLHSNKRIKLELVMSSLNIPNFGIATATDIVHAGFDTVEKVLAMSVKDMEGIPNVGVLTASKVHAGLQDRAAVLRDLAGLLDITGLTAGPLSGKSFCVTGATAVPRKALHKQIMDAGGVVKESVGAGLTYLVTNEDVTQFRSEKVKKAEKYGTSVISESTLRNMLNPPSM